MRINIFDNLLFDVCVIGAGPAGITAALELAQHGLSVALVESGGGEYAADVQKLSDAEITTPDSHSVMAEAVRRGLGGTSALWGGRCVPLDASDYEQRDFVAESGWPFKEADLQPFYQRACDLLGVGDANFDVNGCVSLATKNRLLSASFTETSAISSTHLERWSTSPNLWQAHKDEVASSTRISIISGFTCVGLHHACKGRAVTEATLRATTSRDNTLIHIKAGAFVLACGGIESTRLVLNSITESSGLKLGSDALVGRYYMGHPSGKIADIELIGDPKKTLYGFEVDGNVFVRRRITFQPETLEQEKLLNIAFWLDNAPLADPRHGSSVLSAAYLALTSPWLGSFLAPVAIRSRVVGKTAVRRMPHLVNCLRSPLQAGWFCVRFIYQRYIAKPRLPGFFTFSGSNRYALHYHAEQVPSRSSTISLVDDVDALGLRKAKISLEWSAQDIQSIIRAHEVLDKSLQNSGIGRLSYRYPSDSLEQVIRAQAVDGFHQIGTLRMGNDPSQGVTDPFGRLFGTSNCFVASSAVFPTSGQANPTLTLVALTVRQAEHIATLIPGLKQQHA